MFAQAQCIAIAPTVETGWLDSAARDVSGRAGNGGNEAATWVAAWAAGGQPLTTLAYEFDEQHSNGMAVTVSARVGAPLAGLD